MKIKQLSKQFLVVVLALAVLASTLMLQSFSIFADGAITNSWKGKEAADFAGGSGTDSDPYQIADASQLALLGKYIVSDTLDEDGTKYKTKSYILTADIYLNDVSPLGDTPWYERTDTDLKQWNYGAGAVNTANYFTGKLDGNGYTIKGIYIDTEYQCTGLFIGTMGQVVIKNLGIESSYIKSTFTATNSSNQVGAIVGRINNNEGNTVDISNSYVADSVIITGTNVGGFFGEHGAPSKVTITNCYSSAQISATGNKGAFVAGIGGKNILTVKRSFSTQTNINFVGYNFTSEIYEDCYTLATATVGITKLANLDKMQGEKAKENMPALNYTHKWTVRDGDVPYLTVFDHPVDAAAPTLSGDINTAGLSKTTAAVMWPAASEDVTAPEDMVYTLYMSAAPITDVTAAGVVNCGEYIGETDATVDELTMGNNYYFAVVATDETGKSSNLFAMAQPYCHNYSTFDDWDGTVAEGFTVGNGSAAKPYMILNAEQLAYLVDLCSSGNGEATSGKYYTLNVDINLNNVSDADWQKNSPKEWTVGTAYECDKAAFYGIFNGNGHVIKGLYINESADVYNGLFAAVTNNAVIKNLGIENSYIKAGEEGYAGVLAGARTASTKEEGVAVEYSYIGSDVTLDGSYQGGFFGTVSNVTTIKNSYSKVNLTVDEDGKNNLGTLIGDHSIPNITITVDGCYNAVNAPMVALTNEYAKVTYKNSYTVGADAEGLANRTLEQMTGTNAMNYMRGFDFDIVWDIVENDTPVLVVFVPPVENTNDIWDGTLATIPEGATHPYDGGTGTADDPYLISTPEQFAYMLIKANWGTTNSVSGGAHYKLLNDIYLNDVSAGEWYNSANINAWRGQADNDDECRGRMFYGHIHGNGKTVYGLYYSGGAYFSGLIYRFGAGASVEDLRISKAYVNATSWDGSHGVLVGHSWGNTTVKNVVIDDTVKANAANGGAAVIGGIQGDITAPVTVENCYIGANITSGNKNPRAFLGTYIANTKGLDYTTTSHLIIKNSYYVGANQLVVEKPDGTQPVKFENCYTTSEKLSNMRDTATGVTKRTKAQLTGEKAKANMQGFDFESLWRTRDGDFPILQIFPDNSAPKPIPDEENPQFDGTISVPETTKISITVSWPEAKDDFTPGAFMEYNVYYSESPITADNVGSATRLGTYAYKREATLTTEKLETLGLESKIYFAVVAMDEAGNEGFMTTAEPISPKASENKVWQGGIARSFESGSGTEDDPYIIANAEQLAYLVWNATASSTATTRRNEDGSTEYLPKYYALSNDISLNDVSVENWKNNDPNEWYPGINEVNWRNGSYYGRFYGSLNGNGYVIKGLYINEKATFVGLIPYINCNAQIQKLGIIESGVSVNNNANCYAGAFAGRRDAGKGKDGVRFTECFVDETVEVDGEVTGGASGKALVGGFIGNIFHGQDITTGILTLFKDCYSGAIVSGSADGKHMYYGVFSGDTYSGNVKNLESNNYTAATIVMENCFSTTLNENFVYDYSRYMTEVMNAEYGRYVTYKNCFTAHTVNDRGFTVLGILDMIGKDADKYITGLDYNNTWITTKDGTPMLRAFMKDGENREYLAINRLPVTVTFATGCDLEVKSLKGYVGEKLSLPTITREGYEFQGWYLYAYDSSLQYPIDFFPAFDITLYAKWKDLSTLRVDFEKYPYVDAGEEGLGEDHVWFKPGVDGYNAKYVHSGARSMLRNGNLDTEQSFQLFDVDSNKLEVGKKYELTMWVYPDEVTSGKIMLESSDRLKISKKSTVIANIADVTALKQGEWQQVKIEFTAQNPYVLIRTSGSNKLYFDDVSIYETGVGTLPNVNTGTNVGGNEIGSTGESNAIVICFVVFAASALMMAAVILLKRKQFKGEK